jgi:ABC-type protease/lipase transport system fused ATPase/permease subunit
MGGSHVIGPINRDTYNTLLIAPPPADQAALVNAYFSSNPSGQIIGDGVHLSASGKSQLAAYLVGQMP